MAHIAAPDAAWQVPDASDLEVMQAQFGRLSLQFANDRYPSLEKREQRLVKLKQALLEQQSALILAMNADFGYRSRFDNVVGDLVPTLNHLNYTLARVKKWMKPKRRASGKLLFPSRVSVFYQPVGVVGIMVPWNFPLYLSLAPLITAIAAGNQVMLKLSEETPKTNAVIKRIVASIGEVAVCIEGSLALSAEFSRLSFDHLLFTGSTAVGKLVAQAAAANLTQVTLELGGKSPVIIASDADLEKAVDDILFGKTLNSGQVCVAPDYVMLPQGQVDRFVELYLKRFKKCFVSRKGQLDSSSIINERQYQRLQAMLENAKEQGATLHTLQCELHLEARQMAPVVVTGLKDSMLLMQNEIFGPILPVIGYRTIEDAIQRVNDQACPLALYLMTQDKDIHEYVVKGTHSGGVAINDTVFQSVAEDAPFGGFRESGVGAYHGIEGFKAFSHGKTVLNSWHRWPRASVMLRYRKMIVHLLKRWIMR